MFCMFPKTWIKKSRWSDCPVISPLPSFMSIVSGLVYSSVLVRFGSYRLKEHLSLVLGDLG